MNTLLKPSETDDADAIASAYLYAAKGDSRAALSQAVADAVAAIEKLRSRLEGGLVWLPPVGSPEGGRDMRGSPRSLWLSMANRAAGWWTSAAVAAVQRQQRAMLAAFHHEGGRGGANLPHSRWPSRR